MKLESLQILGFGALQNVEIEFDPGITVLQGANEAGKSTVHRCIRAMLYGLDKEELRAWKPWNGDAYAAVLIYQLDSGQRFRVARDFTGRSSTATVTEVSVGDRTDDFRVGRDVLPGLFHLGVDETVFCATAWLDDEGLRVAGNGATWNNHVQIQQALERLADSGGGVTAGEAIKTLEEASRSLGTDRISQLPMGQATARLRQLDSELELARKQAFASLWQQRQAFEREQEAKQLDAMARTEENGYLLARRAQLASQRAAVAHLGETRQQLEVALENSRRFAQFPTGERTRIAELQQQLVAAKASESAINYEWQRLEPRLQDIVARRDEIKRGSVALGSHYPVEAGVTQRLAALQERLRSLGSPSRAVARAEASKARVLALQKELASQGFGDFYTFQLQDIAGLVERVTPDYKPVLLAALATIATLACAAFAISSKHLWLFAPAAAGLVLAVLFAKRSVRALVSARAARRVLAEQFPEVAGGQNSWHQLSSRLPGATRLREEIAAAQLVADTDLGEIELFDSEIREVVRLCNELVRDSGLETVQQPPLPSELLTFAYAQLDLVSGCIDSSQRLLEIVEEDDRLAKEEADLRQLEEENQAALRRREELEARIRQLVRSFGVVPASSLDLELEAFLAACQGREQFDQTRRQLLELDHSMRRLTYADAETIASEELRLVAMIEEAGLDASMAKEVDATELHRLEVESQRLRRQADLKIREAVELRARVQGSLQNLRSIADIEDECEEARSTLAQLQKQKQALSLAMETLKQVTTKVHHELAPRLQAAVSENLSLVTDLRWKEAFVSSDNFAVTLESSDNPHLVPLERLSHGSRDQISLLLRIALIKELSQNRESVPLLLDEPFLASDLARRERLINFLVKLSGEHQLLVTSHEDSAALSFVKESRGEAGVQKLDERGRALDVFGQAG